MRRSDLLRSAESAASGTLTSIHNDTPAPRVASGSSPSTSGFPLLHPICRIVVPPSSAYQHSRSRYLISYLRSARAVFPVHLRLPHVYTPTTPPTGHCSMSGNPRAALIHEYRSGPAAAPKSASGISSPLIQSQSTLLISSMTKRCSVGC
jgi:hypothetical protein